jgi:capsular polysaccharide transport system permease protein
MSSLIQAAIVQKQVIGALMLRNLVAEYGLSRAAFAWVVIRPVLVIAVFVAIGTFFRNTRPPQGMPLLAFITTGYVTWLAFIRTFRDMPGASRQGAVLMFPHLTPLDLMVARAALDWAIYTTTFVLLVGLGLLLEGTSPPEDAFGVVMGFWAALSIGLCLGVMFTVLERFTTIFSMFLMLIQRVGLFVSGVLFAASALPSWILPWLSWNPIFHILEIMRESWWPAYRSPVADPAYVATCLFFLLALALVLERSTRRWANL